MEFSAQTFAILNYFPGTDAVWGFTGPDLFISSMTDHPSQERDIQMIHTQNLNNVSVTAATAPDASTEEQEEGERLTFPQFTNPVVVYGFPSVLVVGLVANVLSFVTILNSSIRQTSTGLYLCVLAAVDSVSLFVWTSSIWAVPVLGRVSTLSHMLHQGVLSPRISGIWFTVHSVCYH